MPATRSPTLVIKFLKSPNLQVCRLEIAASFMLGKNIIWNTAAKVWAMLINLAFIPLYIRYLGIESYGLIGFFATLQGIFSVMDLGWSTALNRELALHSRRPEARPRLVDLLRTVELIYLSVGILIGVAVGICAPMIARLWLHSEGLSRQNVISAIQLMGLAIAIQWPIRLYSGGLMGLERQEFNAILTSALATIRVGGSVGVLWIAPTIEAFFIWQIVIGVLGVLVSRAALRISLGEPKLRPHFRFSTLQSSWHFAAGITATTTLDLVFTIGDKVIVSALLPLKTFGYYVLASQIASAVAFLPVPIFNAVFPRFTHLVSTKDDLQLKRVYHRASQLLSVTALPPVVIVALFPRELSFAWTNDSEIALQMQWLLPILVIGSGLNALGHVPYALQLATGWTRLTAISTAAMVCVLGPLMLILTWMYGPLGAAAIWLLSNAGYVFIAIPIMHMRLLVGEKWTWYLSDVGRPLVAATAIAAIARIYLPQGMTRIEIAISMAVVGVAAGAAAVAVSTEIRTVLWGTLNRMRLSMRPAAN